ncbi:hypothetical protein LZ554_008635 [Drepanopeziza brunnea f. sp. 'monogermtubi']|nr:hypothetical protein LZ554_008635 [Drepanopeziza brunnea f. sp. 'monogermtubi']
MMASRSLLALAAVISAVCAVAVPAEEWEVALLKRQEPGTPLFACHSSCGTAVTQSRGANACTDTAFQNNYSACLACAGPSNQNIWILYGNTLSAAGTRCGLSTSPASSVEPTPEEPAPAPAPAPTPSTSPSLTSTPEPISPPADDDSTPADDDSPPPADTGSTPVADPVSTPLAPTPTLVSSAYTPYPTGTSPPSSNGTSVVFTGAAAAAAASGGRGHLAATFVTLGDALSSFLESPDPSTVGMCAAGKKDENGWPDGKPRRWNAAKHFRFDAVGVQRWALSNTLCAVAVVSLSIALKYAIHYSVKISSDLFSEPTLILQRSDLKTLWNLGFGTVTSASLFRWSAPISGSPGSHEERATSKLTSDHPVASVHGIQQDVHTHVLLARKEQAGTQKQAATSHVATGLPTLNVLPLAPVPLSI